jgi:hypothetical protein
MRQTWLQASLNNTLHIAFSFPLFIILCISSSLSLMWFGFLSRFGFLQFFFFCDFPPSLLFFYGDSDVILYFRGLIRVQYNAIPQKTYMQMLYKAVILLMMFIWFIPPGQPSNTAGNPVRGKCHHIFKRVVPAGAEGACSGFATSDDWRCSYGQAAVSEWYWYLLAFYNYFCCKIKMVEFCVHQVQLQWL